MVAKPGKNEEPSGPEKPLPPEEQAKVIDIIEEVKAVQAVRTMKSQTFEESTKRVFDRHADLMQKLSR